MIRSFSPFGYEGSIVNVEVDLRKGIPAVDIVGLSDNQVRTVRETVRSAINNSKLHFPDERVLISLSPADLRKEGAGFDLPIALAILASQGKLEDKNVLVMGELTLSGTVRPISATYPACLSAIENGIEYAIIPSGVEKAPSGIKVCRVSNLNEALNALINLGNEDLFKEETKRDDSFKVEFDPVTIADITTDGLSDNMNFLKFAEAVAVAGRHHIIAWGSPGCGKTATMQRMQYLLPKLTNDEKTTTKRIYSLAGLYTANADVPSRPFRMPHQIASLEGICGGGPSCRPGEVSLAHNGVLFLDEAPEFRTSVLQMLRVPMETRNVNLSRAGRTTTYPARFQLAMTMNPCPCGNFGSPNKICLCSAKSVEQYWRKISAPLLDRISIRVNAESEKDFYNYSLEELRELIANAWYKQKERGVFNQDLDVNGIGKYCTFTESALLSFNHQCDKRACSAREVQNLTRLARTLADMKESRDIDVHSVDMAFRLMQKLPLDL